jgi:hypothetical protein
MPHETGNVVASRKATLLLHFPEDMIELLAPLEVVERVREL